MNSRLSAFFLSLLRLGSLFLENNHFTSSIPDLNVPPLQQFNVSNNHLNGSILKRFSHLDESAFSGNSLCGKPLQPCHGTESEKNNLSGGASAGIVIGSLFGLLLILLLLFLLCSKKSGRGNGKGLVFFGNVDKAFDLEELLRASAEVLGKGIFGTTYKATEENGTSIAVKRLKDVTAPENEFREKIEQMGKMVHENLVPLMLSLLSIFLKRKILGKKIPFDVITEIDIYKIAMGERGRRNRGRSWRRIRR